MTRYRVDSGTRTRGNDDRYASGAMHQDTHELNDHASHVARRKDDGMRSYAIIDKSAHHAKINNEFNGNAYQQGSFWQRKANIRSEYSHPEKAQEFSDFDPSMFKVLRCTRDDAHDSKQCLFFHGDRDRRRKDVRNYAPEPCTAQFHLYENPGDADASPCSRGDSCNKAHSMVEVLYHPSIFKKRLCDTFPNVGTCPRYNQCAFAHTWGELTTPHYNTKEVSEAGPEFYTYKFKTLWCPLGGAHEWELCPYAHTFRDLRRTPLVGYSSHPCPEWQSSLGDRRTDSWRRSQENLSYGQRCSRGVSCPFAHGPKEQLYHPHFYNTLPCNDWEKPCTRMSCAFYHCEEERRAQVDVPSQGDEWNIMNLTDTDDILSKFQPTFWYPPKYGMLPDSSWFDLPPMFTVPGAGRPRLGNTAPRNAGNNSRGSDANINGQAWGDNKDTILAKAGSGLQWGSAANDEQRQGKNNGTISQIQSTRWSDATDNDWESDELLRKESTEWSNATDNDVHSDAILRGQSARWSETADGDWECNKATEPWDATSTAAPSVQESRASTKSQWKDISNRTSSRHDVAPSKDLVRRNSRQDVTRAMWKKDTELHAAPRAALRSVENRLESWNDTNVVHSWKDVRASVRDYKGVIGDGMKDVRGGKDTLSPRSGAHERRRTGAHVTVVGRPEARVSDHSIFASAPDFPSERCHDIRRKKLIASANMHMTPAASTSMNTYMAPTMSASMNFNMPPTMSDSMVGHMNGDIDASGFSADALMYGNEHFQSTVCPELMSTYTYLPRNDMWQPAVSSTPSQQQWPATDYYHVTRNQCVGPCVPCDHTSASTANTFTDFSMWAPHHTITHIALTEYDQRRDNPHLCVGDDFCDSLHGSPVASPCSSGSCSSPRW